MSNACAIKRVTAAIVVLAIGCLGLNACAGGIQIVRPLNGSFVAPTGTNTAQVSIQGSTCGASFEATLDGVNVTQSFAPQPPASSMPQATLPNLASGDHTLMVSVNAGTPCKPVSVTSTFFNVGKPTIYMTDGDVGSNHNDRVVQTGFDMNGTGWTTFGTFGTGSNQFDFPRGIFVYGLTKIYVTDQANNRIVMMDDMTGSGWTTFGSLGSGVNQFSAPLGIFVDGSQRIYVADSENDRIVRMDDMTGKNWVSLSGSATDPFTGPICVFVDSTGHIFVIDGNRIVRMNDMTGAGWTTFGSSGSGTNQFGSPGGIFVDRSGRIYVNDSDNCRIVRMNDMTGAGWTTLGSFGTGVLQFNGRVRAQMGGIFVDTGGKIYVVDGGNARLVRMDDMTGAGWTTLGTFGNGPSQFVYPTSAFVKPQSEVVVGQVESASRAELTH